MNLSLRERIKRILGEKPSWDVECDVLSDLDKTIIIQNTPVILIRKNIENLVKKKE